MSVFGNNELFAEFEAPKDDVIEAEDDCWNELNAYKEENTSLKLENEELRKALRIITQPANVKIRDSSKDGPVAQVLLFNNVVARHQKKAIEDFFQQITSHRNRFDDYPIHPQASALPYPTPRFRCHLKNSSRDDRKASKAFTVINSLQIYNDLFCLDQLGEPLQDNNRLSSYIPEYERAHLDALDGEIEVEEKQSQNRNFIKRTCWNCGMKDHQLKDCPSPKDFNSINQRRQQFMGQMNNSPQAGSNRYHEEKEVDESDPRFANFKPGILSDALQDALGVKRNELPPYIYQMRLIGYPPGHLKDARIERSGLSFYSGRNKKEKSADPELEEGPLDISKIIDYPGFNVQPGRHTHDDCERLGVLPMDQRHSKDVMVSYHKHRNALLRRKHEKESEETKSHKRHKPNNPVENRVDDVREVDMDTSDDGYPNGEEEQTELNTEESIEFTEEVVERRLTTESDMEDGELEDSTVPSKTDVVENRESGEDSLEEGEYMDGVDEGNLNEEELQIRRELILRKLEIQESMNEEVIVITDDQQETIDLTSDGNEPDKFADSAKSPGEEDLVTDKNADSAKSHGEEDLVTDKNADSAKSPDEEDLVTDKNADSAKSPDEEDLVTDKNADSAKSPDEEDLVTDKNADSAKSPDEEDLVTDKNADSAKSPDEEDLVNNEMQSTECNAGGVWKEGASQIEEQNIRDYPNMDNIDGINATNGDAETTKISESDNHPTSLANQMFTEDTVTSNVRDYCSFDSPMSPPAEGQSENIDEDSTTNGAPDSNSENVKDELPTKCLKNDLTYEATSGDKTELPIDNSLLAENEAEDSPLQNACAIDSESLSGVPHRSKFAEGMTRFDAFYRETKSQGVYDKLRSLLKDSPRRKPKGS